MTFDTTESFAFCVNFISFKPNSFHSPYPFLSHHFGNIRSTSFFKCTYVFPLFSHNIDRDEKWENIAIDVMITRLLKYQKIKQCFLSKIIYSNKKISSKTYTKILVFVFSPLWYVSESHCTCMVYVPLYIKVNSEKYLSSSSYYTPKHSTALNFVDTRYVKCF